MGLTNKEKYRYSRHISLDNVGLVGQEKLKSARVLVVGAGGLGCPVLQYLTAAGIGTIGIIDFDTVDETNLQRQVLFSVKDVGKNKALAAGNRLKGQNPFTNFDIYSERLTTKNALTLFEKYDIVVDGTDNFSTRYLVNDACVITNTPLVYGAIYKFEGQVSVFNYKDGPSYRCLFPEPPEAGTVPSCSEIGVIGVLPGLIGIQQANEVIKMVLEIGEPLSGRLLTYNSLDNSSMILNVKRSKEQFEKVIRDATNFEQIDYDYFCGIDKKNQTMNEISLEELKELVQKNDELQIVDVREDWEQPRVEISPSRNVNLILAPLQELEQYIDQIAKDKKVVVICQHGLRSAAAIDYLSTTYAYKNLINLEGGIANWMNN